MVAVDMAPALGHHPGYAACDAGAATRRALLPAHARGACRGGEQSEVVDVAGRGGKLFYKVKWKGYPLHWDAKKGPKTIWEHPRHLDNCPILLKQFWDSRDDNPEDKVDRPFDTERWGEYEFCYDCGKVFERGRPGSEQSYLRAHQKRSKSDPNCCWGKQPKNRAGTRTEYDIQRQMKVDLVNTFDKVQMSEHVLGNVFVFVYLGVLIQGNGDWRETPVTRMAIARRTFNEMYPFWVDRTLSRELKLYLYEASCLSILTHGCEAWSLTGEGGKGGLQGKLKGWNARCIATISKGNDDPIDGQEMAERIHGECTNPSIDINKKIRHRRFKWLGQILRLEEENQKTRLLKQAVTGMAKPYPAGSILMDAPEHSSMEQLIEFAHDVDRWAIWTNAILDPKHA